MMKANKIVIWMLSGIATTPLLKFLVLIPLYFKNVFLIIQLIVGFKIGLYTPVPPFGKQSKVCLTLEYMYRVYYLVTFFLYWTSPLHHLSHTYHKIPYLSKNRRLISKKNIYYTKCITDIVKRYIQSKLLGQDLDMRLQGPPRNNEICFE